MALQMCRRKTQSAPDPCRDLAGITHYVAVMSGQWTERATSSASSLQHASELKDLSIHWSKCHWTPVPLCLLGSSLQKMLFEAILWWGREDIRLIAADCLGDWTHWGRALEISSPSARQSQEHAEDERGCFEASPACIAPALELTFRITSIWSLLKSKCSLSAHWGNVLVFSEFSCFLSLSWNLMTAPEMLVCRCFCDRIQSRREKGSVFSSSVVNIARMHVPTQQ